MAIFIKSSIWPLPCFARLLQAQKSDTKLLDLVTQYAFFQWKKSKSVLYFFKGSFVSNLPLKKLRYFVLVQDLFYLLQFTFFYKLLYFYDFFIIWYIHTIHIMYTIMRCMDITYTYIHTKWKILNWHIFFFVL